MLERLDYVKLAPRRILDAGSGPAPQAAQLAGRYRGAQILALDFSLPMLRATCPRVLLGRGLGRFVDQLRERVRDQLRERLPDRLRDRLRGRSAPVPLCADLVRIPLAAHSCSLVWSNMALHWASDPQAAIAEFHRVLEVDGLLMFSTLGPDTLKELRTAFHVVAGSPHVHEFIDMHDLGDMLIAAGFAAPVMDTETITLTYAGLAGLVADLRATGQTCALAGRARGLMGPRQWQRAREALERCMRSGRLPASVEVVYGHAWKAVPRRDAEGHAIVSLGAIRTRRN